MAEHRLAVVVRALAAKRLESYATTFIVLGFAFGVLAGVFVLTGRLSWALLALLGLPVLIVGFQLNNDWFNKQVEALK